VVGSEDGRLYLVKLADGTEVWNYEVGQAITSSPAVVNGRVVVGADDGVVYCFGAPKVGTGAKQALSARRKMLRLRLFHCGSAWLWLT